MKKADLLPEEAAEVLASSLSEEEVSELMGVKQELNQNIRWGRVLDEAFGPMFRSLESLILRGGETVTKKGPPIDSLFPRQRDIILSEDEDKSQIRRHYIILLLMRKCLGGLKTRVNQALASIPTIDYAEEDRLAETAEGVEVVDEKMESLVQWTFGQEERREMEREIEERRFRKPEIIAGLEFGESTNCSHIRKTIRRLPADGEKRLFDELQEYCKDCRTVLQTRTVAPNSPGGTLVRHRLSERRKAGRIRKKDQPCQHKLAEWVPGQEGKVARCCDKVGCTHIITDEERLQIFQWERAGLEPFGDDPSQDEVITL